MKAIKFFSLVMAMAFAMNANAQSDNGTPAIGSTSDTETERKLTHEVAAYIQDGWGVGYQLRGRNLGFFSNGVDWNILGVSYMSNFDYSPADYGVLNFKLFGVHQHMHFNLPKYKWFGIYYELNFGYTMSYFNIQKELETSHHFCQELAFGFMLHKNVAVAYNMDWYDYKGSPSHWAKIAFLF